MARAQPSQGQERNLPLEMNYCMQAEAPIPLADPLVLGIIQVNPLPGWQDSGHVQKTALRKVAKSVKSLSDPNECANRCKAKGHEICIH